MNLSAFHTLASQKLGIDVRPISNRTGILSSKLCDFKIFLGHIFADYLSGFDFWGYTDLDIVFGNISRFISAELLREHDLLSVFHRVGVGHFTLLRITPNVSTLPFRVRQWQKILQSPEYYAIDEWWGRRQASLRLRFQANVGKYPRQYSLVRKLVVASRTLQLKITINTHTNVGGLIQDSPEDLPFYVFFFKTAENNHVLQI